MAMTKGQAMEALEGVDGYFDLRVAIAMPDGEIVSGPLIGIQETQEDGNNVVIFVASAFRVVIL